MENLSIRRMYNLELDDDRVYLDWANEFCRKNGIPCVVSELGDDEELSWNFRMMMTDAEVRELMDELKEIDEECRKTIS